MFRWKSSKLAIYSLHKYSLRLNKILLLIENLCMCHWSASSLIPKLTSTEILTTFPGSLIYDFPHLSSLWSDCSQLTRSQFRWEIWFLPTTLKINTFSHILVCVCSHLLWDFNPLFCFLLLEDFQFSFFPFGIFLQNHSPCLSCGRSMLDASFTYSFNSFSSVLVSNPTRVQKAVSALIFSKFSLFVFQLKPLNILLLFFFSSLSKPPLQNSFVETILTYSTLALV